MNFINYFILCPRFYMIILLSPFFKKLDYYREIVHDIVNMDKLHECFIDLYHNFVFSKLSQQFQSLTLSFLKNHLEPVKNYFLCFNVLFHLFNCPRSNYAVNDCFLCSRFYIGPLVYPEQTVHLRDNTDLHNLSEVAFSRTMLNSCLKNLYRNFDLIFVIKALSNIQF